MKIVIALIPVLLIMTGCGGSSNPTGPSAGGDWLPLEVGNVWYYELTGTLQDDSVSYNIDGSCSFEITGTETHDDGFTLYECERLETFILLSDTVPVDTTFISGGFYYRSDSTGIYEYTSVSDSTAFQVLQLPLTAGSTWNPDQFGQFNVMSLTASISVPLGSYSNCTQIRYIEPASPDEYTDQYYISDIGIGLWDMHWPDPTSTDFVHYQLQLSSYSLN